TLQVGKIMNSFLPSEIYGEQETVVLNSVNSISSIQIYQQKTQAMNTIPCQQLENTMREEAVDVAQVILHPEDENWQQAYQKWTQWALDVHEVMTGLRKASYLL